MELNKKELKKLMTTTTTIAKARKQVQQQVKYWGYDNTKIYVRCYSDLNQFGWDEYSTYLHIEMTDGNEWKTITLAEISVKKCDENKTTLFELIEHNEEKFEDLTWDVFKTMKNNVIKDLKTYNFEIEGTEDYHC